MATKRIVITGRVQGVFFRNWTVHEAKTLGLTGWVRNRRDGSVEMLLAGEQEAVTEMIERCRQGPPAAHVEDVEISDSHEPAPESFEKRPTA